MGEFTLKIKGGEFTDSEIMVMLGENGKLEPEFRSRRAELVCTNGKGMSHLRLNAVIYRVGVNECVCVSAGTGKTTFIRMLAGGLKSDGGGERVLHTHTRVGIFKRCENCPCPRTDPSLALR